MAPVLLWLTPSFCFLSISLLSGNNEPSSSPCTFPTQTLELAISPKNPGSFYWKIVIETNWALDTGCSHFLNKWFAQGLAVSDRIRIIIQVRSLEPPTLYSNIIWPPSIPTCGQINLFVDNRFIPCGELSNQSTTFKLCLKSYVFMLLNHLHAFLSSIVVQLLYH